MSLSRRLFFGSVLGVGAASSIQLDAERQPETISPDDVLVVECDDHLSEEGMANIKHAVSQVVPGVKVLVCDSGMHLRLLRPEAGELVMALDGRKLAEVVVPHIPDVVRRGVAQ
jgi:hypothetical protein